jgi:hypothetical protein
LLQPSEPDFGSVALDVQPKLVPIDQPDLGDMRAHDVALSHLNARGFIQFHPLLAQRLDDFKAAIFMGHALYWSKHLAQQQPHRKGWFFMSAAQWTQATGLSTREQTTVRGALVKRGLLLEALAGRPAIMHFKVDLQATAALLGQKEMNWVTMTELFRASIRFYKPLADICSSVGAGLYLSYLLQRQSHALRNPSADSTPTKLFPGEFVYRPEQARIALCLGSKAQRNARDKLKASGLIREGRSSQEVVATRVNLSAIASCLQAQGERTIRKSGPRKPYIEHPGNKTPIDLALVQPTAKPRVAAILKRSGASLPQRQLNLFTPIGLIANWRATPLVEDEGALHAGAASLTTKTTAPADTPASLVVSLFSTGQVARSSVQDAGAGLAPPEHSGAAKISTDSVAFGNDAALLSMPICRFVEPNLPLCRNYKEQGISRYFQTTTPPAESPVDTDGSRRCVEQAKADETPDSETSVTKRVAASPANRATHEPVEQAFVGVANEESHEASRIAPGHLVAQGRGCASVEPDTTSGLILPERLDAASRAGVLSMVARAPIELQQPLLDELAGNLSIPNKTIHNPIGWLHSLIQRQRQGTVELALAPQIAQQRLRRQQHKDRLIGSPVTTGLATVADTGALVADAFDPEIKRVHLQRLEELKKSFPTSRGGRR